MSVIVKGMRMPKRCFECPLIDATDGFWCCVADKSLRKEHGINLSRPNWCPLQPLPEKHGRLIDADELESIEDDRYSLGEIGRRERDDIVNALRYSAPTIVEREGGADGDEE